MTARQRSKPFARVTNPCHARPADSRRDMKPLPDHSCRRFPRRAFLADLGMGFTGLALGAMLHRDGVARAASDAVGAYRLPDGKPHFAPKAKSVIWLFMVGGTSQMESFDPKPALTKYAGKTIARDAVQGRARRRKFNAENLRVVVPDDANGQIRGDALPAAGRLQEARAERHRGERLVAARRQRDRRRARRALDVDDRQQPRRAAPVPHRPAHRSTGSSRRSARGCTTGSGR